MNNCTLCGVKLDDFSQLILIQEDPDLRARQRSDDEGTWSDLPMGSNGMHYMLLHPGCWRDVLAIIMKGHRNAGFMFYIGQYEDLKEVVLCLN